jgi:hypothetical protein
MDWSQFSPLEKSKEQSFETLCDQLFESWCKTKFLDSISSFLTCNGNGGDGGVESVAILQDGTEIGLQAKWFPTSLSSQEIDQIESSLATAKKNHPKIKVMWLPFLAT